VFHGPYDQEEGSRNKRAQKQAEKEELYHRKHEQQQKPPVVHLYTSNIINISNLNANKESELYQAISNQTNPKPIFHVEKHNKEGNNE